MATWASGAGRGTVRENRKGSVCVALSLLCLLTISAISLSGQQSKLRTEAAEALPPTTGEPLTVKPVDLPDVDCNVMQWTEAPKPTLTLLCPPKEIFAPLRVVIKLSWMKPEDALVKPSSIVAMQGSLTKLHTNKTVASVLLSIRDEKEDHPQAKWVGFTSVVDVALLPLAGSPSRSPRANRH